MEIKVVLTLDELSKAVKDFLKEKNIDIPSDMNTVVVHSIAPTIHQAASLTWKKKK